MRMKMSRGELPDDGHREYMGSVMAGFAGSFSQTMQSFGVSGIRVDFHETPFGRVPRLAEVSMFDGVPEWLSRKSYGVALSAVPLLEAMGIMEISLVPDGEEVDSLRKLWGYEPPPEPEPGRVEEIEL